ncbi:MAG: hypothetical protein PUC45_07375 [Oscillospiraceae bacterium]|nr:hypothetical protein [Oscillospiraceae bacterium]
MKRSDEREGRCALCGRVRPVYEVEDVNHALLGCEGCLTIRRNGVVQL